jgi:hypothetical protein
MALSAVATADVTVRASSTVARLFATFTLVLMAVKRGTSGSDGPLGRRASGRVDVSMGVRG